MGRRRQGEPEPRDERDEPAVMMETGEPARVASEDPVATARRNVDEAEARWREGRAALDAELRAAELAYAARVDEARVAATTSPALEAELVAARRALDEAKRAAHVAEQATARAESLALDPSVSVDVAADAQRRAEIMTKRAERAIKVAQADHDRAKGEIEALAATPFPHPHYHDEIARYRARRRLVRSELVAVDAVASSVVGAGQWAITRAVDDVTHRLGMGDQTFERTLLDRENDNDQILPFVRFPGGVLEAFGAGRQKEALEEARRRRDDGLREAQRTAKARTEAFERDHAVATAERDLKKLEQQLAALDKWIGEHGDGGGIADTRRRCMTKINELRGVTAPRAEG